MQLCANARLLLDMVAASGQPKLWDLTPTEARKKVIELTRIVECQEAIGKSKIGYCRAQRDQFLSAFIRRRRPTMSAPVA